MTGLRVGGGATWICGGCLERAVLTGRVVMFAVTGRVLVRDTEGSGWINGVISGEGGGIKIYHEGSTNEGSFEDRQRPSK